MKFMRSANPEDIVLSQKAVDYLDLISRAAAEDRAERDQETVMPEPAGEPVVDYLAVSKAWKEERGWMDNKQKNG